MRRIFSATCPNCGAGLYRGCSSRRPFQCPECSAWLRIPYSHNVPFVVVPLVLGGLAAYLLGFRGFALLFASLVGFWVLVVPVGVFLDPILPIRPRRSWPDFGTLGLLDAKGRQPRQEPPADSGGPREGGDDGNT